MSNGRIGDKVKTLYVQTQDMMIESDQKGVIVEVAGSEYKVKFARETIYIHKDYVEADND